jgi:hypothetical protein
VRYGTGLTLAVAATAGLALMGAGQRDGAGEGPWRTGLPPAHDCGEGVSVALAAPADGRGLVLRAEDDTGRPVTLRVEVAPRNPVGDPAQSPFVAAPGPVVTGAGATAVALRVPADRAERVLGHTYAVRAVAEVTGGAGPCAWTVEVLQGPDGPLRIG